MPTTKSPIIESFSAKKSQIGADFNVRRALPKLKRPMVGPFIFLDHMGPATVSAESPMNILAHPHIGLATVTYLFEGQILHRDSLGTEMYIRPGEVNWMVAGKGIAHSERSPAESDAHQVEGLQIWVALPIEHEDIEPSFTHKKKADLPTWNYDDAQHVLIAGEAFEQQAPVPTHSPLFYVFVNAQADHEFEMDLKENHEGGIYIAQGEVRSHGQTFKQGDMAIFEPGTKIDFVCSCESKVAVVGGKPFPEKRHIWWNFVSSSQEKIEAAKKAWSAGDFAPVINETESYPLPQT